MSITYLTNGSVHLVYDADPSRALTIPAGAADRDAQIAAFFPPTVPLSVTRFQGRMALVNAGLLDKVEAAVTAAGGATMVWYQDRQNWLRDEPIVAQLAAVLNLTSAEVDRLFIQAAWIV